MTIDPMNAMHSPMTTRTGTMITHASTLGTMR